MGSQSPLYLGFDLSTQQLKGVAVTSDLKVAHKAIFDFDADSHGYNITKGVITEEAKNAVYAPVALWLQAIDGVLERLQQNGLDFKRIKGISGAGQQHGSVYWSFGGEDALHHLDASKKLETQLDHAFSHPFSPNWQDASTQAECDLFDAHLGNPQVLATNTGSKAHHRFTGPQILRFQKRHPDRYRDTSRISLVSSWLASIFLGKIAPWDISDACGANLWEIKAGAWNDKLLDLASSGNAKDLAAKLGNVPESGGDSFGKIDKYFVKRYGFDPDCSIVPFTGDNPSTILALPLREGDAMVSLGTSTTFLMSTRKYLPHPSVHFFNHPTTAGLYMFMLCYKNGGLAREKIRDALNQDKSGSWDKFDKVAHETPPLGQKSLSDSMRLGLFFPKPEIVPNLPAGTWKHHYDPKSKALTKANAGWTSPGDDARAIIESQMLSLRLRSRDLVEAPSPNPNGLPPQPRRIYLVGGGSRNRTIARIAGEILGSVEGVFKLDVGENACALGAAYKAVWSVERKQGETFEDLIGKRWREEDFIEKYQDGYEANLFEQYGNAVEGFAKMEEQALAEVAGVKVNGH